MKYTVTTILWIIICVLGGIVSTTSGYNVCTWQWWATQALLVAAYSIGYARGKE